MKLIWKSVKNMKSNPESVYRCLTCNNKVFCHIHYINANIKACIRVKCGNAEKLSRKMVEYRGWTFRSTTPKNKTIDRKVEFTCDKGHNNNLTYKSLKRGSGCKTCINQNKRKIKPCIKKKDCICKSYICEHYNHGVLYPDSSKEWSPKNDISVYSVAPGSTKKYIFKCHKCDNEHIQALDKRAIGQRCPYCNGTTKLILYERSFEYKYPELVKEWDPENIKKPNEMFYSSHQKISWICSSCDHKWMSTPNGRGIMKKGCPRCNNINYDAMIGGHDYFVKRVNELHGNKYEYLTEYKNSDTKVDILCPLHGVFKKRPYEHLKGSGCPKCYEENHRSRGENRVAIILKKLSLYFDTEKKFPGLVYKNSLRCDFYIPWLDLVIEFDGEVHFVVAKWSGDKEARLCTIKSRDCVKDRYMIRNKINLLRIPYTQYDHIEERIIDAIKKIMEGYHLYISYPEYIETINATENLDEVIVISIDP